jgi:3-isopropylmalate dehydrogenase
MAFDIVVLPGDGIGPEVTAEAVKVLRAIGGRFGHQFNLEEHPFGGDAIDLTGEPVSEETLQRCKAARAVLLGAVGGPKWDNPSTSVRPEKGLLRTRKELGLYTNLRPVRLFPGLLNASPLRPERLAGVDLLIVRELTGGLYFGQPQGIFEEGSIRRAVDTMAYSASEIERVLRVAFEAARARRRRLASVDKANVLATSRLWRQIVTAMAADYPDVQVEHVLVDSAAMRLITAPASFDVLVTENTFGDILSDEASVLAGSLGILPSASLGTGSIGLYEPIHGTAPDIAGRGIANPLGSILSVAMLLRHSCNLMAEAEAVEKAVSLAIDEGLRTADLAAGGPSLSTSAIGNAIVARLTAA